MSKLMELVERMYCEHIDGDLEQADATLSEIRAAVQALERDAARYRWLREEKTTYRIAVVEGLGAIDDGGGGVACTYQNELTDEYADRVIDAAMGAGK